MKIFLKYIFPIGLFMSCNEAELDLSPAYPDAVELKGVEAEVAGNTATRASALDAYNYVGRSAFANGDQMVLTTIKRTNSPINGFTYSGIVYNQVIEQNQTSGGWNRDPEKGYALKEDGTQNNVHPDRIYWSDATNNHTYIGYCVPQQPSGVTFDWNVREATYGGSGTAGISVYYGSIGNPTNTTETYIDYSNNTDEIPVKDEPDKSNSASSYKSGNEKIKCDDLLLTYDDKKVAETGGSVAKLYYHHALALVRVVVNIQGFSASTDAADSKSVVKDMELKNMLTLYKWRQQSYEAEALDETYDASNITEIYGSREYVNQKKNVRMWIPRPDGTGTGVGKQFTFYGLAVPCSMGVDNASTEAEKEKNLHFEFKVKYPDPMNPSMDVEKTYKAMMPNQVKFRAGHCTTINISLNHSNEQMTVGAEYMDWQNVETPDEGELKKGSNFLSYVPTSEADRIAKKIYIATDSQATEDDAMWLYNAGTTSSPVIKDIYGHTGTKESPYTITTAEELLCFAYEVKSGRSFEGQYVKLDANIVMQKSVNPNTSELVDWIGIGDESHPFEGWFDGGVRLITNIKGASFFHTIGVKAHIEQLIIDSSAGDMTGSGGFAEVNKGTICACKFQGSIKTTLSGTDKYVGGFVGKNEGLIMTSYHLGMITADANIGGVVGQNSGTIVASYSVGRHVNGTSYINGGVAAKQVSPGKCDYCFYNKDSVTVSTNPDGAIPLITDVMQRTTFVGTNTTSEFNNSIKNEEDRNTLQTANLLKYKDGSQVKYNDNDLYSLNYCIYKWIVDNKGTTISDDMVTHYLGRYYVYQPAGYPWVY